MAARAMDNEAGASVTAVIIIIAVITLIGVVFTSLFSTGVEESLGEATSTRAFYAAEAGLETAVGKLKNPASNWTWRDGYKAKAVGSGDFDVEVLEYENRDSTLAGANACESFTSSIASTGANPARTVYVSLSWSTADDLGLELWDNAVADCNNPAASATLITSSLTSSMPEAVRYRMPDTAPVPSTYTARVVGVSGVAYKLRIAHPDESGFSTASTCGRPVGAPAEACMRALIAIGRYEKSRREVFAGFSR